MVTETKKPWEMNQKEYEQWYQDNMGEKDNIPYSERVSQWKKQGKLTLILGKPTTLDKSADSSIMTSNKGEEDDDDRQNESGRLGTKTTGERLRSGESHEGMAKDVTPSPAGQSGSESKGSADTGRESDSVGSTGLRGVVESTPAGDSGE